jgi:uncharacterized protein YggE
MCIFKNTDEKIKSYLFISIIATLLIFAVSGAVYVYFYSKSIEPSSYRSFSVSGEGKAVTVPDIAQFTFSVVTEGGLNITELQKENTEKVNKAIEFVKDNDIDDKDIKTQSYNLTPRYQYYRCETSPCPPPEIVGYSVTQSVLVKIRDFDKIGGLFSGVVEKGANSVSQLSFTIDDPTAVQNEAREEAIEKAKEKARGIAKAGGFRLGKLLSIQEGGIEPVYKYAMPEEAMGIGGAAPSPTIEPGSQEVTINVTLTYEIK